MNRLFRKPNEEEQKRKTVCAEQLSQDRQALLMRWPFIGGVIIRMELIPVRDDRLETACTDGNNIFVDIDFYSGLTREQRLFVLAHEVWHSVLLHFARRGKRNPELFNIAADLEIHFALKEERMHEPFVLPHDRSWGGLSAEMIYEKLLKKQKKEENPDSRGKMEPGKQYNGQGGRSDGGFDKHLFHDDHTPGSSDEDRNGMSETNKDDGDHQQNQKGSGLTGKNGQDPQSKGEAETPVMDDDYTPSVSKDTIERVRGRVVASIQQTERTRGTIPGNLAHYLEDLLEPSIPWQEVLKQFVTSCYGGKRRWLPPSRRHVWQDIYLPSMRTESLNAVVAMDTSGSTSRDLGLFFGELVSLMRSFGRFELTVIQCDSYIHNVEHFSDSKPPSPDHKWEIYGGGGTDFCPVFEYIKEKNLACDLLIFFTDGDGAAPDSAPPYPVMWLLTEDGRHPCSWGKKMIMKREIF